MRRGAIIATIVVVLGFIGVGVTAYNAGVSEGIERSADGSEVVRVVDYGPGRGFFPLGFIFFPLAVIGTIAIVAAISRRGRWGGPPWTRGGPPAFEERIKEWHKREHEQDGGEEPEDPSRKA
jgi:hypothetical protein